MAKTDFWFRALFPAVCWLGRALLFLLGPFRVFGWRQVPRKGGVLVLANHISDLDPVAVQAACPRHVRFMAKSELFEMRVLGPLIRWFRAFSVKRGEPDKAALKLAVDLLRAGEVVCVFPEGRISESGKLQDLLPGVALIARMAGVPVICCGLNGTQKVIPYGQMVPRPGFGWVTARWGAPFEAPRDAEELLAKAREDLLRLTGAD